MENKTLTSEVCFGFNVFCYFCAFLGLAPFYNSKLNENKNKINNCKRILIGLFWVIMYAFIFVCQFTNPIYYSHFSVKIAVSFLLVILLSFVASIVSIFTAFIKKYPSILYKILELNLKEFSPGFCARKQRLLNLTQTFEIILIITFSVGLNVCVSFVEGYISLLYFIDTLIFCSSSLCNNFLTYQYIIAVLLIKRKYFLINKYLSNQLKCNTIRKRNVKMISNDVNMTSLNTRFFHELRITHEQMYDLVAVINTDYGVPILFVLCWELIVAISSVHFNLSYSLHLFFILVRLPVICQSAVNEFKNLKILVQKLMLHNIYGAAVNKELKLLSSQLNSMDIEFSVCGFFALNLPFLNNVVGLIVSYIVILVQFK
ncbi:hypothetical protein L9F63_009157 [Diploptera punctata]|uniref:Gustatory receptor n=1 Tax=Diploptera punctata TaxID=6984 RepID=A0AAD7Z3F6_DIPPU|nr:hypothetical protein L9F63_009157 [Diploptera punctata]